MALEARWIGQDAFPGAPHAADAVEEWLRFIERHGRFDQYLPRLRDRAAVRDETLAEIQAAYFLDTCGLPIVSWEPKGNGGTGEFIVALPGADSATMAIEVKAPGWESEVTDNRRRKQPKYQQRLETRAMAPRARLRKPLEDASRQLPATMPTLLIVNDDFFLSLNRWPVDVVWDALYGTDKRPGYFADPTFAGLGGIGVLNIDYEPDGVKFLFRLFENPQCQPEVRVPASALAAYRQTLEWRPDDVLTPEMIRELCPPLVPGPGSLSDGLDDCFILWLLETFEDPTMLSQAEIESLADDWRAGHRGGRSGGF